MNKHELITAIRTKQDAKGLTVQPYDVLNRYKENVLQETFINLSDGFTLDVEVVKQLLTSLQQTGGCTYSPVTKQLNPVVGFVVCLVGYELVVHNVWNTLDLKHLLNFWLAKKFDDIHTSSVPELITNLKAGKTYSAVLQAIEDNDVSITSQLLGSMFNHITNAYKQAVYKGFKTFLTHHKVI